jgi:hypothetical protein
VGDEREETGEEVCAQLVVRNAKSTADKERHFMAGIPPSFVF